ncbi:MAG: serine hydroxymethyltransferase [Deltaproteobacteria bacterium]|jgi:glycine hydroxymethyltransferase|nr:serine hydroxymethyltransferase [Deltaproteobacteria bacterium]MBW2468706.1 serine hydroxymethyltransferase [Deltaproteobacteria bacterium]
MAYLVQDDPEVARIIRDEESRVACTLNLIAAENHAPRSVLEAQGSIFSLKAAEGFPGKRFHAGCRHADELESLAVSRAKLLFGADHANVQPHSGVSANLAVYFSVLDVGDRILSMKLSHGGHLSHGDAASMTSRCFDFQHYGLNLKTEQIDYNEVENLATAFRPRMIIAGASSYPRLIDYERIAKIAQSVSAILLVDMAHIAGLVAAKVIPSPVPHADFVTFTTYKTLRAGRGGVILCKQKYADRINRAIFPGGQGTPSLNLIAAKAVCFHLARTADFVEMQNKTLKNAGCFAAEFERLGYRIVSGGTDNHLVLVDLRSRGLTGALAEGVLESVGIVVNRNVIPADPERPEVSSGIRIGSPAITSRGMQEPEVRQIARMMDIAMSNAENERVLNRVAQQVRDLCKQFPIQP